MGKPTHGIEAWNRSSNVSCADRPSTAVQRAERGPHPYRVEDSIRVGKELTGRPHDISGLTSFGLPASQRLGPGDARAPTAPVALGALPEIRVTLLHRPPSILVQSGPLLKQRVYSLGDLAGVDIAGLVEEICRGHPANREQVARLGKVGGEPQGLCVLHCFEAGGEGIALRLGLPETAAVLRSLGVATRVLRSFGLLGDGRCVDSVVLARLRGVQAGVFDAGIGVRGDGHVYPSVFGVGILMSSHVRRRTVADRNCTCVMRSAGNS
ncbi:hypothetical protein RHRU231_950001 [Rhodococcus ruber]|uniref:Uncharacterized protein n=1 Tax=Rhodococcus ruber TaxID=1830 RepID=A0A098BX99_9NOCA|nr:hypothetical protein RHRU231_950001 [Rhodococcus ruber]